MLAYFMGYCDFKKQQNNKLDKKCQDRVYFGL